MHSIVRNRIDTRSLRGGLIGDLAALRSKEISVADARARALLAKNTIDTVKVELVAKAMNIDELTPLALIED
jgi:hypothetical protein